ncbi:unnamed protein product, partial [Symbiodinium sp. KB8]
LAEATLADEPQSLAGVRLRFGASPESEPAAVRVLDSSSDAVPGFAFELLKEMERLRLSDVRARLSEQCSEPVPSPKRARQSTPESGDSVPASPAAPAPASEREATASPEPTSPRGTEVTVPRLDLSFMAATGKLLPPGSRRKRASAGGPGGLPSRVKPGLPVFTEDPEVAARKRERRMKREREEAAARAKEEEEAAAARRRYEEAVGMARTQDGTAAASGTGPGELPRQPRPQHPGAGHRPPSLPTNGFAAASGLSATPGAAVPPGPAPAAARGPAIAALPMGRACAGAKDARAPSAAAAAGVVDVPADASGRYLLPGPWEGSAAPALDPWLRRFLPPMLRRVRDNWALRVALWMAKALALPLVVLVRLDSAVASSGQSSHGASASAEGAAEQPGAAADSAAAGVHCLLVAQPPGARAAAALLAALAASLGAHALLLDAPTTPVAAGVLEAASCILRGCAVLPVESSFHDSLALLRLPPARLAAPDPHPPGREEPASDGQRGPGSSWPFGVRPPSLADAFIALRFELPLSPLLASPALWRAAAAVLPFASAAIADLVFVPPGTGDWPPPQGHRALQGHLGTTAAPHLPAGLERLVSAIAPDALRATARARAAGAASATEPRAMGLVHKERRWLTSLCQRATELVAASCASCEDCRGRFAAGPAALAPSSERGAAEQSAAAQARPAEAADADPLGREGEPARAPCAACLCRLDLSVARACLDRDLAGAGLTALAPACRCGTLSPVFALQGLWEAADKAVSAARASPSLPSSPSAGWLAADRVMRLALHRATVVLLVLEPFPRAAVLSSAKRQKPKERVEWATDPAVAPLLAAADAAGSGGGAFRSAGAAACVEPEASAWFDPSAVIPAEMRRRCEALELRLRESFLQVPPCAVSLPPATGTAAAAGSSTGRGDASPGPPHSCGGSARADPRRREAEVRAWAVVRSRAAISSAPAGGGVGGGPARELRTGDDAWDVAQACLEKHGELPPALLGLWAQRVLGWAPTIAAAFPAAAELLRVWSTSGHVALGAALQAAQFFAGCGDDSLEAYSPSQQAPVLGLPGELGPDLATSTYPLAAVVGPDVAAALAAQSRGSPLSCQGAWDDVAAFVGPLSGDDDRLANGQAPAGPGRPRWRGLLGSIPTVSARAAERLLASE